MSSLNVEKRNNKEIMKENTGESVLQLKYKKLKISKKILINVLLKLKILDIVA